MALALSIKEKASISVSSAARAAQAKSSPPLASSTGSSQTPQSHAVPSGTTAATVSRVRALFDFQPSEPGELQFRKGDIIAVLESVYKDWWKGSLRGKTGIFPLNYVEKLQDPTRDELEREAQMEGEVFAEIRNVEKLLALLSTSSKPGDGDVRENEEITVIHALDPLHTLHQKKTPINAPLQALYHSTLAIRPKLIELIGKYSQKKGTTIKLRPSAPGPYRLAAILTRSKMTSRSSMRSSSRLAVIMKISSKLQCLSHFSHHTAARRMATVQLSRIMCPGDFPSSRKEAYLKLSSNDCILQYPSQRFSHNLEHKKVLSPSSWPPRKRNSSAFMLSNSSNNNISRSHRCRVPRNPNLPTLTPRKVGFR